MARSATSVIPATHEDILTRKGFAHLATISNRGEPQSHPVWYDYRDGEILLSTTRDRQKFRNIAANPRVALSITDPDNPYRYIEVRGTVERVEDDRDRSFIDHLAKNYMGQDEYPDKSGERVVIHIRPEHAATMG